MVAEGFYNFQCYGSFQSRLIVINDLILFSNLNSVELVFRLLRSNECKDGILVNPFTIPATVKIEQ